LINKLKRKFILINMSFVMIVMVVVLSILYVSNYQNNQSNIQRNLSAALNMAGKDLRPIIGDNGGASGAQTNSDTAPDQNAGANGGTGFDQQLGNRSSSVFTVTLDSSGNIESIDDSMVQIEESTVQEAVTETLANADSSGTLRSLALAYEVKTTDTGSKIAFMDISTSKASLARMLRNEILIFVGSALVFFLISLYLARLVVKPVDEAWRQQKQFTADASHELKTPLTVILANLEILRTHPDDTIGQQKKWIENTKEEAVRMKELLDDLLFLAKHDAARIPVISQTVDVTNVVWSAALLFESVAFERHVELTDHIEDDISMPADEKQLKQLIAILLDNACKYGKNGKVDITLKRIPEKIQLRVTNSVSSPEAVIPKEELSHVFERFYRGDKSRVRSEGGYGLGLSIAAAIVENHHGKIKAESNLETGTSFIITFPDKKA